MNKHLHCSIGIMVMLIGSWAAVAEGQTQPQGEAAYNLQQQAQETCADKESGDVCSFVNAAGDSINGSCGYQGGVGGKLVCIPIH